jgi:hypothetical protein
MDEVTKIKFIIQNILFTKTINQMLNYVIYC